MKWANRNMAGYSAAFPAGVPLAGGLAGVPGALPVYHDGRSLLTPLASRKKGRLGRSALSKAPHPDEGLSKAAHEGDSAWSCGVVNIQ